MSMCAGKPFLCCTEPEKGCKMKRTMTLRLLFVLSMGVAAAVCSFVAYAVTNHLQVSVAVHTYESVALSALDQAAAIAKRKQQGGLILSSVLGDAFPNSSQWPTEVGLREYVTISKNIAQQSSTTAHAFMVIVHPEEVEAFETHAKNLYRDLGYPEKTGYNDEFGFGIYGKRKAKDGNGMEIFHDTTGVRNDNTNRTMLVPFLQHTLVFKNPGVLMMNVNRIPSRRVVFDRIMKCVDKTREKDPTSKPLNCGCVTDFIELHRTPGPAAVFLYPVFPDNNKTKVVGFIGTSIHWSEVLTNVVPDFVDGVVGVISEGDKSFTYEIRAGVPHLLGEGDKHNPTHSKYGRSVVLNPLDRDQPHLYELTVYPTDAMFEEFQTGAPIAVALGFVAVIVACTLIFFAYDHLMKTESHQRKKILDVKRRFVRFVSHEIRTPLNVVKMGLDLLKGELQDANLNRNNNHQGIDVQCELPEESTGLIAAFDKQIPSWIDLTGDLAENTQNAVSVLDDLLNYDKIESGTFKLEFSSDVDIWKIVSKVVSDFSIQARNKNIVLELKRGNHIDQREHVQSTYDLFLHPSEKCWTQAEGGLGRGGKVNPRKLRVMGDNIRLTQAIRNLVSNAVKFVPEGVGRVTVTETYNPEGLPQAVLPSIAQKDNAKKKSDAAKLALTRRRQGSITIQVQDNGAGLSKEQLALLFREGMQFNANKLQAGGGSGLGLCITKEIIENHGGTIKAHSDGLGYGTSFLVEIPLYCDADGSQELLCHNNDNGEDNGDTVSDTVTWTGSSCHFTTTTTSAGPPSDCSGMNKNNGSSSLSLSGSNSRQQHRHILVVDDAISNTKLLVRLLERSGHTCSVAMNGQEAIDKFLENRTECDADPSNKVALFDTILMDNIMPVMDGPAATKQLRELGCKAHIIGVTGNVLAEDVNVFKAAGAEAVLPKPVCISAITAIWEQEDNSLISPSSLRNKYTHDECTLHK